MTSSASSSRFHIIKIDAGPYKRGRWNCRDFDESCTLAPTSALRSDMISLGGHRSGSSNCSSGRASFCVGDDCERLGNDGGQKTPLAYLSTTISEQQQAKENITPVISDINYNRLDSSSSNIAVAVPSTSVQQPTPPPANGCVNSCNASNLQPPVITASQNQPAVPSIVASTPVQLLRRQSENRLSPSAGAVVEIENSTEAILDCIIADSMQRQSDELLTPAAIRENEDAPVDGGNVQPSDVSNGPSTQNASLGSAAVSVVAIDNKIEQAMDLVKTHLLYAVREEVDVLKEKIVDLEKKVFRLETENKLLREYAPPDILQQIQQQCSVAQPTLSVPNQLAQQQQSNTSVPQQQQSNTSVPQQQQSNTSVPQQQQSNTSIPQQQQSNSLHPEQQPSQQQAVVVPAQPTIPSPQSQQQMITIPTESDQEFSPSKQPEIESMKPGISANGNTGDSGVSTITACAASSRQKNGATSS